MANSTGRATLYVDGCPIGEIPPVDFEQSPAVNAMQLSPGEVLLKGIRDVTPHACRVYWPGEYVVCFSFEWTPNATPRVSRR